jgi:hypothetical protein
LAVKAIRILMVALKITIVVLMMGTLLVAILSPRISPFFGYFLCRVGHDVEPFGDPCQIRSELSVRYLVSFRFFDITTVFRILSGCVCFVIYIPGIHMGYNMTIYEVLPSLIFQKNCLSQFQAEVIHLKFSNYRTTMEKYKQVQILNKMFNDIYGRYYFVGFMAAVIAIMIPSGYLLVTSYHVNQLVLIVLVFITIMEYVPITTIFIMASKVWNASVQFRYAWKKNMRLSSRPLTRRYGASLQNLKIKIGSSNFVERNTPFVLVSFCVEQTITLVLLNKV